MIIYWIICRFVVVAIVNINIGFDGPIGLVGHYFDMCAINNHSFFTLFSPFIYIQIVDVVASTTLLLLRLLLFYTSRRDKSKRRKIKRKKFMASEQISHHVTFEIYRSANWIIQYFPISMQIQVGTTQLGHFVDTHEKNAHTHRPLPSRSSERQRFSWFSRKIKRTQRINRTPFMLTVHSPRPKFAYLFPQQWIFQHYTYYDWHPRAPIHNTFRRILLCDSVIFCAYFTVFMKNAK